MAARSVLRFSIVIASLLAFGVVGPGFAQTSTLQSEESASKSPSEPAGTHQQSQAPDAGMSEQDKIAEALSNPLSYLWLLFMQNDTIIYDGDILDALDEDPQRMNTTLLMPVLSIQLTENWKTIFRPVITYNSFRVPENVNISVNNK